MTSLCLLMLSYKALLMRFLIFIEYSSLTSSNDLPLKILWAITAISSFEFLDLTSDIFWRAFVN